jgi:hypothetical protein
MKNLIQTIFAWLQPNTSIDAIVKQYFDAFNTRNLDKLAVLYADGVILSEWDEHVFLGKKRVLEANKKLFDAEPTLHISIVTAGVTNNTSVNEILVYVSTGIVKVVDSIKVENGKIVKIMAYRGF